MSLTPERKNWKSGQRGYYYNKWVGYWDKNHPRFRKKPKSWKRPPRYWARYYHYEPSPKYEPDGIGQEKVRKRLEQEYDRYLTFLIGLAKGKVDSKTGKHFYESLLHPSWWQYAKPRTAEEVRQKLEDAYWVEEEDVRQIIITCIGRFGFFFPDRDRAWRKDELEPRLEGYVRDYLLRCKIFSRNSGWEEPYAEWLALPHEEDNLEPEIALILQPPKNIERLTLFNRYLFYLSSILNLKRYEVADCLNTSVRQINRWEDKFVVPLEQKFCKKLGLDIGPIAKQYKTLRISNRLTKV